MRKTDKQFEIRTLSTMVKTKVAAVAMETDGHRPGWQLLLPTNKVRTSAIDANSLTWVSMNQVTYEKNLCYYCYWQQLTTGSHITQFSPNSTETLFANQTEKLFNAKHLASVYSCISTTFSLSILDKRFDLIIISYFINLFICLFIYLFICLLQKLILFDTFPNWHQFSVFT